MANFFDPGKAKEDTSATPSPAAQAREKFRADILGKLLEYASQSRPSFSQFASGAALPAALPGGLSAGIPSLLAAYNAPGAFTATKTGTLTPPSTSGFSDAVALAGLLGTLYQSGALGGIGQILGGVGGALHIPGLKGPDSNTGGVSTGDPYLDASIASQYGGGTAIGSMVPGGDVSNLPADYPGLNDSSWWWS